MLEQDQEPHICFNCDAEFVVHTLYDMEEEVSFCPYCGSEVESEFDDEEEEEEEEPDGFNS